MVGHGRYSQIWSEALVSVGTLESLNEHKTNLRWLRPRLRSNWPIGASIWFLRPRALLRSTARAEYLLAGGANLTFYSPRLSDTKA
jgi:hypothetical protein